MDIFKYVEKGEVQRTEDTSFLSRYRPVRLIDVICTDMAVLCVNQWFRKFKGKDSDNKRFLMISGPSGVGKSTMASLALSEHGFDREVLICATSLKSKKDVTEALANVATDGRTGVIVDNVDLIDAAYLETIQALAGAVGGTVPFIFVCERHEYGRPTDITKHCEIVALRQPPRAKILDFAERIARAERISVDLDQFVDKFRGDIRNLVMTLELNKGSREKAVYADEKDSAMDAIEITRHLFSGNVQSHSEAIRMVHTDINIITSMVSENYLDVDGALVDIHMIASAADAISASEVIETRIFSDQQWDLWDFFAFLGAVYPSSLVVRAGGRLADVRFTRSWSRISNMYLRRNMVRQLADSMRKHARIASMDVDYLYGISSCLSRIMTKDLSEMVKLGGASIPYETMLFVLRLSLRGDLKQTMINKIRKEYESQGFKEKSLKRSAA